MPGVPSRANQPRSTSRCGLVPERIPLCRIGYLGDDEDRGFAVYDPATESYTDAIVHTGHCTGHPNDAYDTVAIIHLADYQE